MSSVLQVGPPPPRPAESVRVIAIAGRGRSGGKATLIVHAGAAVLIDVGEAAIALRCLEAEGATLTHVVATSLLDTPTDELVELLRNYPEARFLVGEAVRTAFADVVPADRPASHPTPDSDAGVFQVGVSPSPQPAVEITVGSARIAQIWGGHAASNALAPGLDLLLHLAQGVDPPSLTDDLRSLRPACVLPIAPEAEWKGYLAAAKACGLGPDRVLWMSDGEVLDLARRTAFLTGAYPVGSAVPTRSDHTDRAAAAERVRMADAGVVNVVVTVDVSTGRLTTEPSIVAHGVHGYEALLPAVQAVIADYAASWSSDPRHDLRELEHGIQQRVSDLVAGRTSGPLVVTSAIAVHRW